MRPARWFPTRTAIYLVLDILSYTGFPVLRQRCHKRKSLAFRPNPRFGSPRGIVQLKSTTALLIRLPRNVLLDSFRSHPRVLYDRTIVALHFFPVGCSECGGWATKHFRGYFPYHLFSWTSFISFEDSASLHVTHTLCMVIQNANVANGPR